MFSALFGSIGIPNDKLHIIKNYRLKNWDSSKTDLNLTARGDIDNSVVESKSLYLGLTPIYERTMETETMQTNIFNTANGILDISNRETSSTEIDKRDIYLDDGFLSTSKMYFSGESYYTVQLNLDINYYNKHTDDGISLVKDKNMLVEGQVFLGVGTGRIYKVSSVIRALRINERMKKIGKGSLSDDEIDKIAYLISKEDDYSSFYSRPDKYLWGDIAKSSGGKLDQLSVYVYEYLKEAMFENIGYRAQGHTLEIGLMLYDSHQKREYDSVETEGDMFMLGPQLRFSYYNNITTSFQVSVDYDAAVTFILEPDLIMDKSFNNNLSFMTLYNITDRLLLANELQYTYSLQNDDFFADDRVTISEFSIGSYLNYMILDKVDLYFDFNLSNMDTDNFNPDYVQNLYKFETSVSTGIKIYLFDRIYRGR